MSDAGYRVRRATVDDLRWLTVLWQSVNLPVLELEKHLTEFQIIETADGQLLGAVGLQIAGRHGRIHSEAFADFGFADQFRPLLWERLQSIATNHGLLRIWTQEQSPFWSHNGFLPGNPAVLQSLPEPWRDLPGAWLSIQLRDDLTSIVPVDKQIELLMSEERKRTERMRQHARLMKNLATLAAVILAIFVIVAVAYLIRKNPGILRR